MNLADFENQSNANLRGVPLSREVKKALVKLAHVRDIKYKGVVGKHCVSYNTLRGYQKLLNKRANMCPSKGRPPKLDIVSMRTLKTWLQDTPSWKRCDLRGQIRSERIHTVRRQYPDGMPSYVDLNICRNTVGILATRLIDEANMEITAQELEVGSG